MNVQYHRLTDAGFAYAVRMPERMHAGLPMIIQLHGAGERGGGEDLEKAEIHGLANILTETREEDCVLIEPRCPEGSFWVAMLPELKRFVCRMIEAYACDPDRVTLTGLSMGGYGTWFLAMAAPELFAAIAPCCGGGMPWNAEVTACGFAANSRRNSLHSAGRSRAPPLPTAVAFQRFLRKTNRLWS